VLLGVGLVAQLGLAIVTGYFGYVGNAAFGSVGKSATAVTTATGYTQCLTLAAQCVPLAVTAATIRAYKVKTPGAWLTLVIMFAAAVSDGAIAGNKGNFGIAVLSFVIPYSVIHRRLPAGAITAAILFFLLIIIPFTQVYRANAIGSGILSASQAIGDAPAIADRVMANDVSMAGLGQSAGFLAERVREIDNPAIIMQRTPSEIPFSDPAQLLTSPVLGLIPRVLWPGKPMSDAGYIMSQQYYQLPPQEYTSTAVTPEGDLYRHGGWFPLILGMFLIGCGLRVLDGLADLRRSIHGVFLILLLFPSIVMQESDFSALLSGIPGMVLLWFAVVSLSFTRRPLRSMATGARADL
jgi:hypothetical protein